MKLYVACPAPAAKNWSRLGIMYVDGEIVIEADCMCTEGQRVNVAAQLWIRSRSYAAQSG